MPEVSDKAKKEIESLSDEEMLFEINLGNKSRYQREKFAYLQTCWQLRSSIDLSANGITWIDDEYDNRILKNNSKNNHTVNKTTDIPNDWHNKPIGKIFVGVSILVIAGFIFFMFSHYLGLNIK